MTGAPPTSFRGLLVPGVAVMAAAAAATRIRAYDFFWHLAAGRLIVGAGEGGGAVGGGVPRTDPFSFTAAGVPWVDHGWLYQAVLWRGWELAGAVGVWIAKLILAAGIGWVAARHLERRAVAPLLTVALMLVALRGASVRFMDRPEMVTLLFAALAVGLLLEPGRRRWSLAVIPLTALWINLHAGAVLAPLLVGAVLAGVLLDRLRGRPAGGGAGVGMLAPALGGSALALLANPYGWRVLAVPFELAGIVGQPWAANPEWSRPLLRDFPVLYAAAAGWVVAAILLRRRFDGARLLLGLLACALGLRYVRNVGLFYVLLPFVAAPALEALTPAVRRARGALTAGLAAAGSLWLVLTPAVGTPGPGLEPGRYPVQACDFLQAQGVRGRWFNEVAFGGYLIWRFPERPVFIDGRNEIHAGLLREIHFALEDPARFWAFTAGRKLDVAILRYPPGRMMVAYPGPGAPRTMARSWSEVYFPRHDWALVHWDDTAMVRVRRTSFDPGWIEALEFRELNPDDWPHVRDRILAGEVEAGAVRRELERRLAADPGSRRAHDILEELEGLSEAPRTPPEPR